MSTKETGIIGEKIAEKYLKDKGYQILDRNYSFRIFGSPQKGEVDIIAKKDGIISFVEVKTLKFSSLSGRVPFLPEDKVDFSKQRKLMKTAESWLMKKRVPLNSKWQIDIISIIIESDKAKISHFVNAVC